MVLTRWANYHQIVPCEILQTFSSEPMPPRVLNTVFIRFRVRMEIVHAIYETKEFEFRGSAEVRFISEEVS